jgi:hypothetical protein
MNFKINGLAICALLILSSLSIGMASALSDGIPELIQVDSNGYRGSVATGNHLRFYGGTDFYSENSVINAYSKSWTNVTHTAPDYYLQEDGYLHMNSDLVDTLGARYILVASTTKFPLSGMKKITVRRASFYYGEFVVNVEYLNGSVLAYGGDLRTLPTKLDDSSTVIISEEDYDKNGAFWA